MNPHFKAPEGATLTYSDAAWNVASKYSSILASETRDLAMHIEEAIRAERKQCGQVASDYARALSKGTHPRCGSIEEIGQHIAFAILNRS